MTDVYQTPLVSRYASKELSHLFSAQVKYETWRKLWIALAEGEKNLGLSISDHQISLLKTHVKNIDFKRVAFHEQRTKHEVMAHIHAYAEVAPEAEGILHLGATSSYVMDNGDLILFKQALEHIYYKLLVAIDLLATFAQNYAKTGCIGFTHFQEAQPTTVGKRACTWLQDLYFDAVEIKQTIESFPFLGVRGATGTQSSFLHLLGSEKKVDQLEQFVAKAFGFTHIFDISTQTYPRKFDVKLSALCSALATSFHKFATDIRLLSHTGELLEPFEEEQVGSSAMPYKRNPMRSERMCSIARFVLSLEQNAVYTASTQWLERSLDDSANRRMSMPQQFLGVDALLNIAIHLIPNLRVELKEIDTRFEKAAQKFSQELHLMDLVKQGESRQKAHEMLRKETGKKYDVEKDKLLGTSAAQVNRFITSKIKPLLQEKKALTIPQLTV